MQNYYMLLASPRIEINSCMGSPRFETLMPGAYTFPVDPRGSCFEELAEDVHPVACLGSSRSEAAFQAPELDPLHADSFSDYDLLPALLSCIEASNWEGEFGDGGEPPSGPGGSTEELGTGKGKTGKGETGEGETWKRGSTRELGAGEQDRGGDENTGNGKIGQGESGELESRETAEQETAARPVAPSGRPNSAGTAGLEIGQSGVSVEPGVKACDATFVEASPSAAPLIPHVTRKRPRQDLASSAGIDAARSERAIGVKRPRKTRVCKVVAADDSERLGEDSPFPVEISRADSSVAKARQSSTLDKGENTPSTKNALIEATLLLDQQKPPHLNESPVRHASRAKACHAIKPRLQNESSHSGPLSESLTHIENKASACKKGARARSVSATSPPVKPHVLDDLSFARQLAESTDPEDKIVAHALGCLSPGSELTEEEKRLREELVNRDPKEATEKMSKMTFEELSGYFELSLAAACKSLGIGRTLLKKRCRELGVSRWPYDKIRSIKVIIDTLKGLENGQGPAPSPQISDAIRRLEIEKGVIEGAPALGMTQEVKKLRQACNKLRHQNRGVHSPGH